MKLGRLLKAASVAFVPLVAGVLFLMVPASAQNNGEDPDIHMFVDASDFREGRSAKLIFSFGDGQPDEVDRHVYLAIRGTATEGSQADFTITGSNGSSLPSIGNTLYDRKIVIPAGETSAYARINVRKRQRRRTVRGHRYRGPLARQRFRRQGLPRSPGTQNPGQRSEPPAPGVAPIGVGTVVVSARGRDVDRYSERSRRRNQEAMDVGSLGSPGWPLDDRRTLHGQIYTQGERCRALSTGRSLL